MNEKNNTTYKCNDFNIRLRSNRFIKSLTSLDMPTRNIEDIINKPTKSNVPIVPVTPYTYITKLNANQYEHIYYDGEYNMSNFRKMVKTESLCRVYVDKFSTLTLIQGWVIASGIKKAADYVKFRLNEIELVGHYSLDEHIEVLIRNLLPYSNGYMYIQRSSKSSSGSAYKNKVTGKEFQPISRIETIDLDMFDVHHITDQFGNTLFYDQYLENNFIKRYTADEIIHFKLYPGKIFGNPIMSTVVDDITMLRRLEDNMILQSFQNAIPPIVLRVPASSNLTIIGEDPNVIWAASVLESLKAHGGIVLTSECSVEIPGPSTLLDLTKYLQYSKSRSLAGLHMSSILIGEGNTANKSTAAAMIDDTMNHAKYVQNIFSRYFQKYIINDILLSSKNGYYSKLIDKVFVYFPEIDIEYKHDVENHALLMYNGGLFTSTESREKCGKSPLTEQDKTDLYANNSGAANSVKQNQMPTNQSGTTNKKSKVRKSNDNITYMEKYNQAVAIVNNSGLNDDLKIYLNNKMNVRNTLILKSKLPDNAKDMLRKRFIDTIDSLIQTLNKVEGQEELTIDKLITYNKKMRNL